MRCAVGTNLVAIAVLAAPALSVGAPEPLLNPAAAVAAAMADMKNVPPGDKLYMRYISLYNVPAADRAGWRKTVSFVCNSLSRGPVLIGPTEVSETLLRVDLRNYKIEATAWENLGEIGSGRTPIPEPYWHRTVEQEKVVTQEEYRDKIIDHPGGPFYGNGYNGEYLKPGRYVVKEKSERVLSKDKIKYPNALGGWVPKEDITGLVAACETKQPIYRADWFCYYALLEPRYHEFLGLGDKEADFAKLAAADEKNADEEGAQARGAVLFSEVAPNNRILERTPTIRLYGRGWYAKSFDFASSVKLEDVLQDVDSALSEKAGAHEIITSLKNGLQAYFVSDKDGKRLDRAGIEFARDLRNGFRSPEVEIRNCVACHGGKGMLAVDDEVRGLAKGPIAAAASVYSKKDKRQAERFLEKYAAAPLDDLLKGDGTLYQNALKSLTNDDGAAFSSRFVKQLLSYEAGMTVDDMAREVGITALEVKQLIPRIVNPDHSLVAAFAGRKARREQWESTGFYQLAEAATAAKVVK